MLYEFFEMAERENDATYSNYYNSVRNYENGDYDPHWERRMEQMLDSICDADLEKDRRERRRVR